MSIIIQLLFTLTVTGSTIVVCLLVLRLLLPNAISIKWHYEIRKMAIVFYLLPIAFLGNWFLSLLHIFATTSTQVSGKWYSNASHVPGNPYTFSISADIAILLTSIWGIGVIAFTVWQVYCYRRFLKKIQHNYTPISEYSEIAKQLVLMKGALSIKRDVRLAYSAAVRSPVLIGLRKPTIYLPQKSSVDLNMCMVLHHELVHLKRNDLWVKVLVLGANALHWFNPFIYILRRDIHTWSELSCDKEVVKDMSYTDRKRYGETLLSVMEGSKGLPVRFCSSLSGDGKKLKRRLNMILNVKKLKKRTIIISIMSMIVVGMIGTSTAIYVNAGVVPEENDKTSLELSSNEPQEAEGGYYELVSVKLSDESKFPKDDWEEILKQIENNEVILEEE